MKYIKLCLALSLVFTSIFAGQASAKDKKKILHMPPSKIAEFVEKTVGDKRVVMIYTSWCPVCQKIMPKVMDIENLKPGSVIAISEDEDHVQFVRYVEKYKNFPFMIFLSRPTSKMTLNGTFQQKFGAKPWEGYPHFILLDAENNIVDQGNFEADKLADFLLAP